MSYIKFSIKNEHEIQLDEDAKKGDLIDINKYLDINKSNAIEIIKKLDSETQKLIQIKVDLEKGKFETKFNEEKTHAIEEAKKITKLEEETKWKDELNKKDIELNSIMLSLDNKLLKQERDLKNNFDEERKSWQNEKEELQKEKEQLESKVNTIERQQNINTVKTHGENLEKWCKNEYDKAFTNGAFENCEFFKDNEIVKDQNEEKGSKADFIFKIYDCNDRLKRKVLASVCCEVKTEFLSSKDKLKNAHYFKKLEKNKIKKGCEYSLLITELEPEQEFSIQKVSEYKDMYMARPSFFISFLAILNSTYKKISQTIMDYEKREKELKNHNVDTADIQKKIKDFKSSIIDKSIKYIQDNANEIHKLLENINKNSSRALECVKKIIDTHLDSLMRKIDDFDLSKLFSSYNKHAINNIDNNSENDDQVLYVHKRVIK